jgi:hypothetical protein
METILFRTEAFDTVEERNAGGSIKRWLDEGKFSGNGTRQQLTFTMMTLYLKIL